MVLIDPAHAPHDLAHDWFGRTGHKSLATCPITENGLLRIVGHPKYPNSPGPPSVVAQSLAAIRALPGHVFWPDSISVSDPAHLDSELLSSHSRVTDTYLLAPARACGGRLASMDNKLATEAVKQGDQTLVLL